ncbi:ABC transporter ATP-binding protein [Pigmentiphaga aceris]|uniref:ABC transporter ATP-binding protein n=1 Tax=Pigmentiphaga aceris TaxID=1940612 RepID=A0A5C0ASI8_9BURK|nr:ABC transporter ATP-binding protein [Pigmentiphaga aceris]QEI04975.1 ABC transporter ATP-binding protein [Pigmentiphaga aceris]
MNSYLDFDGVAKRYGAFQAVSDFTLPIHEGELVALLGPSGCGKTTSLRMLAGFVQVSEGSIRLAGKDITQLPSYRRNVGMVFQGYALFPHLTVEENVAFGLEMRKMKPAEIGPRVQKALARVRLESLAKRLPRELSGGQQQRVALARAMAIDPAVLLLDEPLSALDARLRHEVRAEIRQLQKDSGLTTLMVTHDQDEALSMADRLVIMNQGRIEQIGTPDEVYERPINRFVAEFMGKSNFLDGKMGGEGRFDSKLGQVFAGHAADAGRTGAPALMSFRPERVQLRRVDTPVADGCNGVQGRIVRITYLGPLIEYRIALKDDTEITALLPNTGELGYVGGDASSDESVYTAPGSPVSVQWQARDSRLLPA